MATAAAKSRVVILGGGFAGVEAAIALSKTRRFDVTVVSERSFLHLFPVSIWTPTRTIAPARTQVALSAIASAHGFEVRLDEVTAITPEANQVTVGGDVLDYDYLIVALGAGKPTPPGAEHTLSLCAGPAQAIEIRDRVDALLEHCEGRIAVGFGANPKDPSAMRGGPAFEILFNIDHLLRRRGMRDAFELTFFAPMATPGQRMGEKALAKIGPQLAARGIAQRVGSPITTFEADGISFANGTRLPADLIIFIPGGVGHPVVTASGLPVNEAGFLKIDANTLVDGTSNVYAVGDVAELSGPDFRAKQGHVAEAMAHAAAANIINAEAGRNERVGYAEHVSILCLMDTGDGAVLVYRSTTKQYAISLPVIGHWLKRFWGFYARNSKLKRFPRLPGL
ncbi:MAG: FAD-dependent oxidoreductase [Propionibacteriales bacterium]|nr:FAD-dependent oxidoreductase [Propionibacteriales bacterium]